MATDHLSVTSRAIEPLLVRPATAWKMLGCGNTFGYRLLATGELESFMDGKARKIVVTSIHGYITRKLQAAAKKVEAPRRGRPRKQQMKSKTQAGA